MAWFSTRGQVIQTLVSTISLVLSVLTFFGPNIGLPNVPAWLPPGLIGIFFGSLITFLSRKFVIPTTTDSPLELLQAEIVKNVSQSIQYKNKLYLMFKNGSDQTIIVGPRTEWKVKDLSVDTVANHVWSVEAGSRWSEENSAVLVAPGQRLKTWVGLESYVDKDHLTRFKGRAGTLITSVVAANQVQINI